MGFIQAYKMAIKSIINNKVRSFLTMLGVIIGVASVISAVAFAQGSTKNITDSLQSLGTNLITVQITSWGSNRNVSYEGLKQFADENSTEVAAIAPIVSSNATVKAGSNTRNTSIIGTSEEYAEVQGVNVQAGRFLHPLDIDYYQKVAIIGTAVKNDVFEGTDPIGQTIKINGQVYKVVGVLEEKDNGQDYGNDDRVIIPVTVAQRQLRQSTIRNFSIRSTDANYSDSVITKLKAFLYEIYNNENAYRVNNSAQMVSTLNSVTNTLMIVLGGIAAISLIVGGIGIMNIMLVSVTERTREIGIRKAIGAKRRNILIQFLIEAVIVTGIGGILGLLIGILFIRFIIGGLKLTTPVYSPFWMLLSFGISLIVGIVFGLFPAYKAAKLNPIEALRFE